MPHGPSQFAGKGRCIYCGATGVSLSDEHIVPYGLGGSHVIRDASCRRCSNITSKFELRVLRDLWGDARASYNAPTRRRQKRKTEITMPDAGGGPLTVPASEHPGAFVFYTMNKAGLLQGLPEDVDISPNWKLVVIDDDKRRTAFLLQHPERLTMQFRHVPDAFARLIAKIGYGHVLTELDLCDFSPITPPFILGEKANMSFVVGGTMAAQDPEPNIGYRLQTAVFGARNRILLLALVRLLANTSAPAYHVVVGEVNGEENVVSTLTKLGVDVANLPPSAPRSDAHWAPDVSPLPFWLR